MVRGVVATIGIGLSVLMGADMLGWFDAEFTYCMQLGFSGRAC
jgi:hypothetical protein